MEASYLNPIEIIMALARSLMPLIMFIASAYYLSKKTEPASLLLAIGSFISLTTGVIFNLLASSVSSEFYGSMNFSIVQGLAFLGNILFTVGFVMLVIKIVKKELDF